MPAIFPPIQRAFHCILTTLSHFAGLANIAGDGPNARDAVFAAGVMQVQRRLSHSNNLFPLGMRLIT
jgi:hypothetical protein